MALKALLAVMLACPAVCLPTIDFNDSIFTRSLPEDHLFTFHSSWKASDPKVAFVREAQADVQALVSAVLNPANKAIVDRAYSIYFKPNVRENVFKLFRSLQQGITTPSHPEPLMNKIEFQKKPYGLLGFSQCKKNTIAYIDQSQGKWEDIDQKYFWAKLSICEPGWKKGLLKDLTCQDLGDHMNIKMRTFASILMHEIMHFRYMGDEQLGRQIEDHRAYGYGPTLTRILGELNWENGTLAMYNADSYVWFATEVYWSVKCGKAYAEPREKIDDRDPDFDNADEKDGNCVIM